LHCLPASGSGSWLWIACLHADATWIALPPHTLHHRLPALPLSFWFISAWFCHAPAASAPCCLPAVLHLTTGSPLFYPHGLVLPPARTACRLPWLVHTPALSFWFAACMPLPCLLVHWFCLPLAALACLLITWFGLPLHAHLVWILPLPPYLPAHPAWVPLPGSACLPPHCLPQFTPHCLASVDYTLPPLPSTASLPGSILVLCHLTPWDLCYFCPLLPACWFFCLGSGFALPYLHYLRTAHCTLTPLLHSHACLPGLPRITCLRFGFTGPHRTTVHRFLGYTSFARSRFCTFCLTTHRFAYVSRTFYHSFHFGYTVYHLHAPHATATHPAPASATYCHYVLLRSLIVFSRSIFSPGLRSHWILTRLHLHACHVLYTFHTAPLCCTSATLTPPHSGSYCILHCCCLRFSAIWFAVLCHAFCLHYHCTAVHVLRSSTPAPVTRGLHTRTHRSAFTRLPRTPRLPRLLLPRHHTGLHTTPHHHASAVHTPHTFCYYLHTSHTHTLHTSAWITRWFVLPHTPGLHYPLGSAHHTTVHSHHPHTTTSHLHLPAHTLHPHRLHSSPPLFTH